ncbi:MAG: zeta toxin family protein [Aphanocapsa sp. GSE-SYN-MK-11-07L]|jgi:D-glycerate 3-kinase|nr:zeta toxin family protein [Aphanocapsa sp. GSE-SYN-MK-11-07L]
MGKAVISILQGLAQGQALSVVAQIYLETEMLADAERAIAFNLRPDNAAAVVERRAQTLPLIYLSVQEFWLSEQPEAVLDLLWHVWLPLALALIDKRQAQTRPLIQGMVGSQGAGKTTLTRLLRMMLSQLGYPAINLSLDDFYKTYAERQELQQADPRLVWRGPPGTHDLDLAISVLEQLRQSNSISVSLPRFDKSAYGGVGDRRPDSEQVSGIEIVLFEGWFVGARPIDPEQFATAPPPINSEQDRNFASDINTRLKDYLPLWQQLDGLIVLDLVDYRLSQAWRQQAEHAAIAAGQAGMSDQAIRQFVEYFWRSLHPQLFIKPLTQDPTVDLVIEIQPNHQPGRVYRS